MAPLDGVLTTTRSGTTMVAMKIVALVVIALFGCVDSNSKSGPVLDQCGPPPDRPAMAFHNETINGFDYTLMPASQFSVHQAWLDDDDAWRACAIAAR